MSWMPLRWLSMRLERLLGLRRLRRLLLVLGPLCLVLEPTVFFLAGHSSVQRTNSGSFATLAAIHCLGQGQVAPELLQMRGHDCPSEGLRPLWRVEPDLERDRDSRQHTTQHNDLERRHCPWAFGPRRPLTS